MATSYITPTLFQFLRDLKENNDREWFKENKRRFEQEVRDPLLAMIADFGPLLHSLSPHYDAIPTASGGSLFRIYRDVRFSANKDPYKTHAGIHFRHSVGKNVHAPGYYLHLEPGSVFIALGIWQPERDVLARIREAISENPDTWVSISTDPAFTKVYTLEGESLKRAPKGYDPEHPLIQDLRRKDFIGVSRRDEQEAIREDFLEVLADTWGKGDRFMRFLTESSGHPF